MPPMFPLRAVFKEETHKGARDSLSVRRVSTNRGVVASITRSRGAHCQILMGGCGAVVRVEFGGEGDGDFR